MLHAGAEALSLRAAEALADLATAATAAYHDDNPLRPGIPKPALAERLELSLPLLEELVSGRGDLIDDGATVRSAGFSGELSPEAARSWDAARALLRDSVFGVPRRTELDLDREVLHALLRDRRLIAVGDDLVYLPEQIDDLIERVREMEDGFTVADFRDALGVTRKHAVPLLEWLDRAGVTRREGDVRMVRGPQSGGPGPGDAPSR
jgi:selenocysteine-specific elongation factor